MGPALFSANYTAKDCGSPNEDTYACNIYRFAKSLTKTLRDFSVDKYGQGGDGNYLVKGEALIPATFVSVQWQWILLPAAVWVSGFVTWAAIAFQTWRLRLPKWRDDLLPLMFLYRGEGRSEETHNNGEGSPRTATGTHEQEELLKADGNSIWAYQTVAEQITVQFHKPSTGSEGAAGTGVMRLE